MRRQDHHLNVKAFELRSQSEVDHNDSRDFPLRRWKWSDSTRQHAQHDHNWVRRAIGNYNVCTKFCWGQPLLFYTLDHVYHAAVRSCLSWTFPPPARPSTSLIQDVSPSRIVWFSMQIGQSFVSFMCRH